MSNIARNHVAGVTGPSNAESVLTVDNPFAARDPELLRLCADERERCLNLLLLMHAARDLHEPDLLGDAPRYQFEEVRACVQMFSALAKLKWNQTDLAVLEAYSRHAWRSELSADMECVRFQIQNAVSAADDAMARLTGRDADELPSFGG